MEQRREEKSLLALVGHDGERLVSRDGTKDGPCPSVRLSIADVASM